ncbi:amino acid adenylation domain-containing protein [Nostoc sp. CALU 546]|uniref:amino acid adenylation domain-containing protein n=1 Tax=Nostoc sp. CALU 546 TaxID=1867241 RepID=UPI003B6725E5
MNLKKDTISQRRSQLSPAKQAILEKRLRGESESNTPQIVIPRRSQQSPVPLSFAQQRLWLFQQLEPQSFAYNELVTIHLEGVLNLVALNKSINEIVSRHESLRTTFELLEGQPVQVIHPTLTVALPVVNLSEQTAALQASEVERLTNDIIQKPFDLASDPLLRGMLLQTGEQEHLLLFSIHHIVCDGWSVQVLTQELAALYAAFCAGKSSPLSELPIQYPDFSVWQHQWLQGEREKTQLAYWKQQLADASTTLIPTDRPRPPVQSFKGAIATFKLSSGLTEKLKSLSNRQGVTLFMTLLTAFQAQLYRYTNQQDICIGSPIANRNHTDIEGLIGFFVNTLVLRTDLSGNPSFLELLKRVREVCVNAYAHADITFERLVEELHPERHLSQTPLFQIMFDWLEDSKKDLMLPDLTLKWLQNHSQTAKFDLTLSVVDAKPALWGWLEYSTDLFDAATIDRMIGHFTNLLEAIVTHPEKRLLDLPLLTETECQTLLLDWNDTAINYPQDKCIQELFEAQVERTPDAVAVVFEEEQLTYRQLNVKANQLAHHLQTLGVKPEVLVGICVERSLDMIIGLLGILKAGGAYLPLDPSYPQERLAFILEDSQVPVLLTQTSLMGVMPQHKAKVVCLDADWHLIAQQSQDNILREPSTDNLAYVIYTSGSTGKPKGVQIPHSALSNFLQAMRQKPGLTEQDILLAVTTISFDIAALELFLPIITGACLVIASQETASDGALLSAKLSDSKATVMQATPATWQLLLAAGWDGNHSLKILCGGEALPGQLANQLLNRCDALWNMYGPTETTIWSAASLVKTVNSTVPISGAIANTQLYILDQYHQLVPVGVPGELCIGGKGLARGYLNRPELTAEKFISNPFSQEATRLYKTGDKARYLPNGEIEYLGRIDYQVKIRGFRIELGEIEALISQYPVVRETVVVATDTQSLVAYIVTRTEQTLAISELRNFLESKLPSYMVPTAFVILEALPLTPNGKVDRKALPTPSQTQLISQSNFVAPSTPIEEILISIWTKVLGIEISIYDNFFEVGGHSLLATRLISQIRQVFQVELPLRRIFEKPTIIGLAKDIEKATRIGSESQIANIERISRFHELPLSFAQQRLWFLAQLDPNSSFYNIPAAVRLQGQLHIKALQQSFNEIIRRHEALRTNFQAREGQPVAIISSETSLTLPIFDISELSTNEQEAQVKQLALAEAQQTFDLKNDLLLRVKLLCLSEAEYVVLFTMHHIVSDGWSIGVLVRELVTLYQAFCDEQPLPLAEFPVHYVDFAAWQRQWLQKEVLQSQISYWLKHLENAPKVLELPTDHPRPAIQTYRGATYSFELSSELSVALNQFSQQQGSTLFMTLLAAFQTLLWRYTSSEDIVVGSPIANRNRAEIEGLIGFFVNTLVLRTNFAGNPTFEELLTRVREVALGAYAHQDLPFELLVEELQPQRDLSHTPLFQVMFVLQNAPMSDLKLPGLTLSSLAIESGSAKFDLTLEITETQQGLFGTLEYNTDLFEASTISRMAGHLQILLQGIVANPKLRLSELPLLTQPEQHQLFVEWNDTKSEYLPEKCIHEWFESQVESTPDAVAVVYENHQLTYRELNTKANQLAHYLRSLGVKSEVLVGICVERSLLMVIGLLAILKAGGAYIPLDPSYPQQRLAYMLEDSQPTVLLTQQQLVENLPAHKAKLICLDTNWEVIAQHRQQNPDYHLSSDRLAYVIYTSGSTGKPKGAMNTHRGICNRLLWMQDQYQLTATDRVLQKTPFSFDVSVWEFFWPLITGARLVIAQPEGHRDPNYLVNVITQQQITTIHFVPSMLQMFLEAENLETCESLLRVIVSGEALPVELQQRFCHQLNAQLHNLYGPTEAAVDVTFWQCQNSLTTQKTVPIGYPIANIQIYLLDGNLNPVPIGVPGEIYIGGVGVGRGYLNRPELTAEKFIPNPLSEQPGTRLYKTGDKARYLPNGEIEYIGRIDYQVKIRGFRIELGEIEAFISQYPTVRETVVVATDTQNLVAYIVPHIGQTLSISELRNFLESKLPSYMVPAAFVTLEALPLTPNGKCDRKALPAPDTTRPELEAVYQPPQTEVEQTIADIWQNVLQIESVGIHDNFFELGGHSLLLVQVHSKLREVFKKDLSVIDLFRYPTISSLADYFNQIKSQQISSDVTEIVTEKIAGGKSQQRKRLQKLKSIENNI